MIQSGKQIIIVLGFALLTTVSLVGCSSSTKIVDPKTFGPVLSTAELASEYNARIEPLNSFWSRISIRAKGKYDNGDPYEEQGTGHLQIQRPGNISLSIRKLGELYFSYGANHEHYWAINLLDKEHKTMQIGRLDRMTPEKAAIVGMQVHPGQLSALMGLQPIDLTKAGGTRWAPDGKSVGVTSSSPWGSFTLWIDPRTYQAVRSEAFNSQGSLIATVSLTRFTDAKIPDARPIQVPGKVEIRNPNDEEGFVRIEISEPAQRTIRPMVFDPNKLNRGNRIHETIDLDAFDAPASTDSDLNGD